jgi:hypothetical protein
MRALIAEQKHRVVVDQGEQRLDVAGSGQVQIFSHELGWRHRRRLAWRFPARDERASALQILLE